jgi:hypothetical protein
MKRAEPKEDRQQTTTQNPGDFRAKPRPQQQVNFGAVIGRILYCLVWLVTFPIRIVEYLTKPPGSSILFALLAVYMILLSVESYAQAGGVNVSFVPKFGIDDGGNFINLPIAMLSPAFYPAVIVSMAVGAIQAWLLRDISPDVAKAQFDEVKHHRVPNHDPNAIDLVEMRRRRLIGSGTRTERIKGVVLLGTYAIDLATSYTNYPLAGVAVGKLLINAVYFFFSVAGSETFINLFRDSIEEGKHEPKVEVIN